MRHLFPALVIFCLTACGANDADAGPGGVSVGEARALDEAAAMLEQQRLPLAASSSGATPAASQPAAAPSPPA